MVGDVGCRDDALCMRANSVLGVCVCVCCITSGGVTHLLPSGCQGKLRFFFIILSFFQSCFSLS